MFNDKCFGREAYSQASLRFNPRNRANLFYSPLRLRAAFRGFFNHLVR